MFGVEARRAAAAKMNAHKWSEPVLVGRGRINVAVAISSFSAALVHGDKDEKSDGPGCGSVFVLGGEYVGGGGTHTKEKVDRSVGASASAIRAGDDGCVSREITRWDSATNTITKCAKYRFCFVTCSC